MFGAATVRNELEDLIHQLVGAGSLEFDMQVRRNGPRHKRLLIREGFKHWNSVACVLDLFIADEANWGNTLAIRTGDADFSRMLVTPRRAGGLMPGHLAQHDGSLWHGDERIDCLTEERFFEALGLAWVEPQVRNIATAHDLARRGVKGGEHAMTTGGTVTPAQNQREA